MQVVLCLVLIALISACGSEAAVSSPSPTALAAPSQTAVSLQPSLAPTALSPSRASDSTSQPPTLATTPTTTAPAPNLTKEPGGLLTIEGLTATRLIGGPQLGPSFYALTPIGLYITRDGGLSWAQVTGTPLQDNFGYSQAEPGTLYAGAGADCYRGGPDQPFYKSVNGGATWNEKTAGMNLRPAAVHPQDANQVWAIGCTGPAFSSDGGETWTMVSDELFGLYQVSHIVPLFTHPGGDTGQGWSIVYVAGVSEGGSGLVASSQDAQSWTPLLQESPERPFWWVNDIVLVPNTAHAANEQDLFVVDPHGVWHSHDKGNNWAFSETGLETVVYRDGADFSAIGLNALAVDDSASPQTIYLGTTSGVYHSIDQGAIWTRLTAETWHVHDLALAPADPTAETSTTLFITTEQGVYVYRP